MQNTLKTTHPGFWIVVRRLTGLRAFKTEGRHGRGQRPDFVGERSDFGGMDASAWNSNSQASGFSRTSSNRTADIHTDAVSVNVRTSAGITHPPINSGLPYTLPENCSADHFSALCHSRLLSIIIQSCLFMMTMNTCLNLDTTATNCSRQQLSYDWCPDDLSTGPDNSFSQFARTHAPHASDLSRLSRM